MHEFFALYVKPNIIENGIRKPTGYGAANIFVLIFSGKVKCHEFNFKTCYLLKYVLRLLRSKNFHKNIFTI